MRQVQLTDLVASPEGIFIFTVVANSPDSLGIWHGTYGMLGLRYRWALGDTSLAFP